MSRGSYFKRWDSKGTVSHVLKNRVAPAYVKFGLIVESYGKQELEKGHGVLSGTLRRSIHIAEPGYNWAGDDVEPSEQAPERGGQKIELVVPSDKVSLLIGSGLRYAMAVHQGHGSFQGYHFLTNPLNKAKPELPGILDEFKDK